MKDRRGAKKGGKGKRGTATGTEDGNALVIEPSTELLNAAKP